MSIFSRIKNLFRKKRAQKAFYSAANVSRLTASLAAETNFINNTLRYELKLLRARSRQAAANSPFAKRFINLVVDNVCGPIPFKIQAKIKKKNGALDSTANANVELAWNNWSRDCEISERFDWDMLQRLIVQILATDGEVLIKKYKGPDYGKYGYRLQIIDVDRLCEMRNESLPNGGAIHMGVEINAVGKPVRYHILKRKPSDWQRGYVQRDYEIIPAEDIIHIFRPDYAEQVRGVPWMYAAMLNLVNLGAFEESAIIAARVGASQMGIIESSDGGASLNFGDGVDSQGNPEITAEPGTFPVLPPGYKMGAWNPKYPDAAMDPFIKACTRGISAGVNVAHHNLSNDMTEVNYSSARIAELSERENWKTIQNFVISQLHRKVYADWLPVQILMGNLPIPFLAIEKYKEVRWQGRRWAWVDPQKEITAKIEAINNRLTSRTRVIAEQGDDIEEIFSELEEEEKMLKALGLNIQPAQTGKPVDVKPEESENAEEAA